MRKQKIKDNMIAVGFAILMLAVFGIVGEMDYQDAKRAQHASSIDGGEYGK